MNLTFVGFLRGYCRELTGVESDSLAKLLAAVNGHAPAAAEAVMVFAAAQGKASYLARLASGSECGPSYKEFCALLNRHPDLEECLRSEETPERYRKVWQAWEARRDRTKADRRVIGLMRERTLEALRENGFVGGVSAYAICRELGLNKGNFYAYLNKGDLTKVSRATARSILQVAQERCGVGRALGAAPA